jgi:hypothetical protein
MHSQRPAQLVVQIMVRLNVLVVRRQGNATNVNDATGLSATDALAAQHLQRFAGLVGSMARWSYQERT